MLTEFLVKKIRLKITRQRMQQLYDSYDTRIYFFFFITTLVKHTVAFCTGKKCPLPSEESVFLYLVIDLIKQRGMFSRERTNTTRQKERNTIKCWTLQQRWSKPLSHSWQAFVTFLYTFSIVMSKDSPTAYMRKKCVSSRYWWILFIVTIHSG